MVASATAYIAIYVNCEPGWLGRNVMHDGVSVFLFIMWP